MIAVAVAVGVAGIAAYYIGKAAGVDFERRTHAERGEKIPAELARFARVAQYASVLISIAKDPDADPSEPTTSLEVACYGSPLQGNDPEIIASAVADVARRIREGSVL